MIYNKKVSFLAYGITIHVEALIISKNFINKKSIKNKMKKNKVFFNVKNLLIHNDS